MQKTKRTFLVKSDQLKIVMVCLWVLTQFYIFKDTPWPLEFYETGGRVLFGLCATLPFIVYFFSGKCVTVDFANKTVRQSPFVFMKILIGSHGRSIPVCEMFLVPEVLTYMSEHKTKEVAYSVCAGEFVKPKENRVRPGLPLTYFALRNDITSFKKAEFILRDLAKNLEVPARIYWKEIKPGTPVESKAGVELDIPFKEPDFIKDLEEDPLFQAIFQKRKQDEADKSQNKPAS